MSEQFNQGAAIEGKMLLGLFNAIVHGKQINSPPNQWHLMDGSSNSSLYSLRNLH
jgi:hypothetical protein